MYFRRKKTVGSLHQQKNNKLILHKLIRNFRNFLSFADTDNVLFFQFHFRLVACDEKNVIRKSDARNWAITQTKCGLIVFLEGILRGKFCSEQFLCYFVFWAIKIIVHFWMWIMRKGFGRTLWFDENCLFSTFHSFVVSWFMRKS